MGYLVCPGCEGRLNQVGRGAVGGQLVSQSLEGEYAGGFEMCRAREHVAQRVVAAVRSLTA